MIQFVRDHLDDGELLAQLAEEAVELSHAALKLRRVYDGRNPTPVGRNEAHAKLWEEIADVLNCLRVLGYSTNPQDYQHAMDQKLDRWVGRILHPPCAYMDEKTDSGLFSED